MHVFPALMLVLRRPGSHRTPNGRLDYHERRPGNAADGPRISDRSHQVQPHHSCQEVTSEARRLIGWLVLFTVEMLALLYHYHRPITAHRRSYLRCKPPISAKRAMFGRADFF